MKSIKVSHDSKNAIKYYGDGSYDENINQLINDVVDYMPLISFEDSSTTVVKISDDTVCKLESLKLSKGESIENVVIRMMIIAQSLNKINE